MVKLLTIYTPTYNRGHLLGNLYNSLCRQTSKNFVWVIIDDGSKDNTKQIINSWKKEKIIDIIYYYKQNGGVHTARDLAYKKATTELIMGVDSDDQLIYDSVEYIENVWNNNSENDLCGILMPVVSNEGVRLGTKFPDISLATYQQFTFRYRFKGDKQTILKTNIIKNTIDAPIFENERLVGETYKWIQLPNKPFLIVKKDCTIHNYENNGYSKNIRYIWFKNLNGFRAEYEMNIKCLLYPIYRVKYHIGFIMTSLYLKDKSFIKKSPRSIETLILTPLGIIGFIYSYFKWGKYRKEILNEKSKK